MTGLIVILVAIAALIGLYLWFTSSPPDFEVISNGTLVVEDASLKLVGKPDRIYRLADGTWIPVEKKTGSTRLFDSHRLQLGVYLLAVEAETGRRPPHGIVELAGGREHTIDNTFELRSWVTETITAMRADRAAAPATPFPAKCASCGVRSDCDFAR